MRKNRMYSFTALMLALALALTAPLAAWAEGDAAAPGTRPVFVEEGRAYLWNETTDTFQQDAALTENPVLDGNLAPEVMAIDPDEWYIHPALDVQGCLQESTFTVQGDVRMAYEGESASFVTAVLAESLPDLTTEEAPLPASVNISGGISVSASTPMDGDTASAYGLPTRSKEGLVTAEVGGNITAEASAAGAAGGMPEQVQARAMDASANNGGHVEITVEGNATAHGYAEEGNASAHGIAFYAWEKGTIDIRVKGDITATVQETDPGSAPEDGEENWLEKTNTKGIMGWSEQQGTTKITVDGKISAASNETSGVASALDVTSTDPGSRTEIIVGRGAEGQIVAGAIQGGETVVTIREGGVTSVSGKYGAVYGISDAGTLTLDISGDILATDSETFPGTAVGANLNAGNDGTVALKLDGNLSAITGGLTGTAEGGRAVGLVANNAGGKIRSEIVGDITAVGGERNDGIELYTAEGQETDILVNGTVRGSGAAVVLVKPETQIGKNVTLTVWELVPNQDGATVVRTEDVESGELAEDEAAEQAVQYIIRVRADQEDIISTRGTEEYQGYDVAHEGDTVTLLLNVPAGYEITGAYGDVNQSAVLQQDGEGNYYLTVPRGGAVELSVTMQPTGTPNTHPWRRAENADRLPVFPDTGSGTGAVIIVEVAEVPETASAVTVRAAAVPADNTPDELLTLTDTEGSTTLCFYTDGSYLASYDDGSSEKGRFSLKDDTLVLVNDAAPETEMPIAPEGEDGDAKLDFHPSAEQEKTIVFDLTRDELDALRANRNPS